MAFHSGIGGTDPLGPEHAGHAAGPEEIRYAARSPLLAVGTLACPLCDAPVDPGTGPLTPPDPLACPYCAHVGAVRDFLSLSSPSRPARVAVRVVCRERKTTTSA